MAGLLDSLSVATTGLTAARIGLDVTGQNIANINTPGYTRRTVQLAALAPNDPFSPGRGVEVVQIRALRDQYIESRIGREVSGQKGDEAALEGLRTVEAAVGLPGESIDAKLTAFFDAFSGLASDVTSPTARDSVVREAQALSTEFRAMSGRFSDVQRVSDGSIRAAVAELNELASTVARLNNDITGGGGVNADALRDERAVALSRMAELANVTVMAREDGAVDLSLSSGHALVIGGRALELTTTSQPSSGFASLQLSDVDVTSQVTGGRIGGLLTLRDATVPGYQAQLDQLAFDVATQVNALHTSGFDSNGAAGGAFFAAPGAVAGAAASLSVSSAVAADSGLVAGSATGAVGDNGIARAIAGLRESRSMGGGTTTASEAWAGLVYRVGADVRGAQSAVATRSQVVTQLEQFKQQQSGVSLDEEAANLMRYQRSYEASARYFSTIVDTLDILMTMVR